MTLPKIIFVNRYFFPDHSATSQLLSDLCFRLALEYENITVVTSNYRYDSVLSGARLEANQHVNGVNIYRIGGTNFGRSSLIGRAIDYLSFYGAACWRLARLVRGGDIVVAMTDPPLLSVFVGPIVRWRSAHLINWYQDLFPEVAEGLGLRLPKMVCRMLGALRDRNASQSIANVVIGDRMRCYLEGRSVPPKKLCAIPNWFPSVYSESGGTQVMVDLREHWGLSGKFVVAYSGNLGRAHDWQTLARCAFELRSDHSVCFLMIGGGAGMEYLRAWVEDSGLDNVVFKPYQPLARLGESLSASDAHLVSLQPSVSDYLVPSKVYGIAAVGRPIIYIGDEESEIGDMLRRYNFGVMVRPGESSMLCQKIRYLSKNTEEMRLMGERGRQMYEENYSASKAHAAWQHLLANII